MFEEDFIDVLRTIIRHNQPIVECRDGCIYCYYQFGLEQVGAMKRDEAILGFMTKYLPNNEINSALAEKCKRRLKDMR